jgi:endonuclease/exonuclease/phosphatase family metal-dependent hydrolase
MNLVTWNVLHRIHAVNWQEPALAVHADERARIAGITEWIARGVRPGVYCLQEVSGDQLAAVKALDGATVFEMKYPRVPRYYRYTEPLVLEDPAEYLAVVVFGGAAAKIVAEASFPSDRGKGFLAVAIGDTVVIDTHVSFGDKHAAQCAQIVEEANKHERVIVCGDFNADRETVLSRFPAFTASRLGPDELPTRPRGEPSEKSQNIDHVLARGCTISAAAVIDGRGLSDHNPVHARVE